MKTYFDGDEFHLTETTVSALKIFMVLYLKNFRGNEKFSHDCWTWGLATINDFSSSTPIDFIWGGDEDIPTDEFKENEIYVHI